MADFEFAILGAGAMGSIIGAHLARAGHTVAMLARGERARQLEERGLAIRGLAEFSTPVRTLRDPASLESAGTLDRKSTRLNSSHRCISYAVFCLKKKKNV